MNLTIRAEDYSLIADRRNFLVKLRELTLDPISGMNQELNRFEIIHENRNVDCKILTAYCDDQLVGWALLSKEISDYPFMRSWEGFYPEFGLLFEVFIRPEFRRQGIATQLLSAAKRIANNDTLCVCPWDFNSEDFYAKFKDSSTRWL